MLSRFHFLVYLCLLFNIAYGQQYNFKHYTPKNGLASSIVNATFQDSRGYLWFGTQAGLSRFNGKEFKNFTKAQGLISNDITFVTEDRTGNIWIGTTEGVSMFDGVNFTNYSDKNGFVNSGVYCIYVDEKNTIWFAIPDSTVYVYDGKLFKPFITTDGSAVKSAYTILQDKKGNYWFGSKEGIAKYDGVKITRYNNTPSVKNRIFFSSLLDSRGNIWFGGIQGDGVVKFNGEVFEKLILPDEVKDDFIGAVTEDRRGNFWFATDHGLLKFDNNSFHLFTEEEGLSSNGVLSVCTDYENNILIGTQGGGVNFFNNESFVNYKALIGKNVSTVCELEKNSYLIGTTESGLNFYNALTNEFTAFSELQTINSGSVFSTLIDNKQQIWVGAQEGVFILQKTEQGRWKINKQYKKFDNTELVAILKIIQSKNNEIWAASYGSGLIRITDERVTVYNKKNGLVSENIFTVFEDSKSNIWIGTKDEGVIKYNGSEFITYSEKEGLPDKAVWSITEDNKGNMYFGTWEGGLSCYDGKQFKTISKNDGLSSNHIPALLFDPNDNTICIGTERGINKLKLKENFEIEYIRYYGEQEGYKGIEINHHAILLDKEGMIWLGTINGLFRFNRKYDYPNIAPPKLDLTSVRLAYQLVDWKKYADSVNIKTNIPYNLKLSYENNHLTFHFQALTTSDVKYSYILEGLDKEWSPLSNIPEANFTNIPPGRTYTFKVKAVNNNGVWSQDNVSFTFTIRPPWWQTWWFYSISLLVLVSGILGFINYRTAKLAKEKKVLEEKVIERTLELKQTNTRLSEAIHAITDSMNYAQRIQQSFLTSEKVLDQTLNDYFILYKPRDIVSGDFYWTYDLPDRTIIACADCTGHGIPGAFMSLIGLSLLNEISHSKGIVEPANMLDELRRIIILGLNPEQSDSGGKDGMDITLISIMKNQVDGEVKINFSGANSVLCLVTQRNKQSELLEFKGDKQPVGYYSIMKPFTQQEIVARKGDMLYMFTDGYADQFGGENGKKFMARQLKKSLLASAVLPTNEQRRILSTTFTQWQGELEQVDDVTVVGIRIV